MNTNSTSFEFSRKTIHLLCLAAPFTSLYSLLVTQLVLGFFIIFYSCFEWRKVKRRHNNEEKKSFAKAPLLLALGVLFSISFFSWEASLIGIFQAGFSDTIAALFGKKWGKTKLPLFTRKTIVGSCAFFIASLPLALYYLPGSKAIIICMVGAFLESLPFKDWDNLTVPIIISFLAQQFLYF